jgi:predicted enzyme related to lactoylglutathione lyase
MRHLETVGNARIKDATTAFFGVNPIELSVKKLDETLAFYQKAINIEVIKRKKSQICRSLPPAGDQHDSNTVHYR